MEEEFKWHGFAKVWLWIVFIVNILSAVLSVGMLAAGAASTAGGLAGMIGGTIIAVGSFLLLFKMKKLGFYFILAASVIALIVNIIMGRAVSGIASAVISVLILWIAINGSWKKLS